MTNKISEIIVLFFDRYAYLISDNFLKIFDK